VLFFRVLQRFGLYAALAIAVVLGACQEPDPNFGDPNGIVGKKLPNEKAAAGSTNAPPASGPTTTMAEGHLKEKATKANAPAVGAAKDCLTGCHTGDPGPKFAFGGRVETGGKGEADVTVNVGDLPGVKTDKDGYFWSTADAVKDGDTAAVQKGANPRSMGGTLTAATGGGCGSAACHGGGTAPIAP